MTNSSTPQPKPRVGTRPIDPHKLDVEGFARHASSLEGQTPAAELTRLADMAAEETPAHGWPEVVWQAHGEQRSVRAGESQVWLRLQVTAQVSLTCQRCLKPMAVPLELEREYRFVRDEDQAASLDLDAEEDVLSLGGRFDLIELIEDELLLALPLVPRHDQCPEPLAQPKAEPEFEVEPEERPNPFAALAGLKGKGKAQ